LPTHLCHSPPAPDERLNSQSPDGLETAPAVTVGIPTHNRAQGLKRALESVLDQTERDLEVIISDDASSDETSVVVGQLAQRDARVRYIRREAPLGLTENFNFLLAHASGRYVMLLADDDYIDPNYIARCRAELDRDAELGIVAGSPIYHEPNGRTFGGRDINLLDARPARRVLRYFGSVTDNVCIYGLMRTTLVGEALPMRNCLAGDWLLVARIALLAKVRTTSSTHLHRSTEGTSATFARTVRRMGLSAFEARHPHLAIMRLIREDIAHRAPVYDRLTRSRRHVLALASALQIVRTRPAELIIEELFSRPPLRRVYVWARGPAALPER